MQICFVGFKILLTFACTCSGTRQGRLTWHLKDYVWLTPICRNLVPALQQTLASSSPTFCQTFKIRQWGRGRFWQLPSNSSIDHQVACANLATGQLEALAL